MRKKLALLGLCVMAALTIVACGSPSEATPTIEPTNKVTNEPTNEPTSEPISEVPSVTPSEEATPTPSEEPTPTPSETPTPTPSETPTPTPSETPTPTPSETPTPTPSETPTPTPSVVPDNSSNDGENNDSVEDDDPTPSTPSEWDGDYDNLPSDGFDHIKVPTIDDFYDEGLSNNDGAFDFGNRPEWEKAWYDAYDEFLVALGSPVDDEGNVYPAFMSINPGYTQGYQYLYYGVNWSDDSNGWGDIVIYPSGLNPSMSDNPNYKDSYILETTNFFYGEMDKGLEDEYRAATTMMLSWIVPNPSQVEKAIYDFHVDQVGNTILVKNVLENGFGSWVQVGDVDIAVAISDIEGETLVFAIRNHK